MPDKDSDKSEASEAAAALGAIGGKRGTGLAKRRPQAHYDQMVRARLLANAKRKKAAHGK